MTLKEILSAMASSIKNNYVSKKELGDLAKHYSYIIDFSKSNPASMITYADDSDAAAMSTDWFNILGLKLCVLKDGKVLYYLNPNNVTKQINGAAADITTLGNDVMLEIPRMGTDCMWLDSNRLKITITTAPNRAGYDYRAFSLHKYNDCDKIYIGRYHTYITENKAYSSSGKKPSNYISLDNFRTCSRNRGAEYTDIGICDNILLQCLYLLIVKNFNSQAIIGRGISDTGRVTVDHINGGANTFGWLNMKSTNKNSGTTAICCLGIENLWGGLWTREDGCLRNSSRQWYMAQYADQYNNNGTGYEYIGETSATSQGFLGRFVGLPKFIFLTDATSVAANNRGDTTYICDLQWVNESYTVYPAQGGWGPDGGCNGVFAFSIDRPDDDAGFVFFGSRLVYKHVEGGGA